VFERRRSIGVFLEGQDAPPIPEAQVAENKWKRKPRFIASRADFDQYGQ
jgi:hypothetical protein